MKLDIISIAIIIFLFEYAITAQHVRLRYFICELINFIQTLKY